MRRPLTAGRTDLADEGGFSLIELLVAMAAGLVVVAVLFTIIDISLGQTTRVLSRVDVTQRSRTALARIENQLHSSCVGNDATPIQGSPSSATPSDGTHLTFLTGSGSEASVTPVQHTLAFTPNGTHGTLTDTTPSGTEIVLDNVDQSVDSSGNPMPVFQYFKYEQPKDPSGMQYRDPSGKYYEMLIDGNNPLPSGAVTYNGTSAAGTILPADPLPANPLDDSNAVFAAEVLIDFTLFPVGSDTNQNLSDIGQPVSDAVVLRFTPAPNHDNGQAVQPCA
jgi:type II secretory pathway pseudopilin PulG